MCHDGIADVTTKGRVTHEIEGLTRYVICPEKATRKPYSNVNLSQRIGVGIIAYLLKQITCRRYRLSKLLIIFDHARILE